LPQDLDSPRSDEVYGLEWFVRVGPPGILDLLGSVHPC
jgi:hypothetical protein